MRDTSAALHAHKQTRRVERRDNYCDVALREHTHSIIYVCVERSSLSQWENTFYAQTVLFRVYIYPLLDYAVCTCHCAHSTTEQGALDLFAVASQRQQLIRIFSRCRTVGPCDWHRCDVGRDTYWHPVPLSNFVHAARWLCGSPSAASSMRAECFT